MSSGTNKLILAQETLKSKNAFKGYAKRVVGNANSDIAKNNKISGKKK